MHKRSQIISFVTISVLVLKSIAFSPKGFNCFNFYRSTKLFPSARLYTTNMKIVMYEESFSSYLSRAPNDIKSVSDQTNVNIIMGNEAGDADSIISSLSLSYVNFLQQNDSKTDNISVSMPLVSIDRNDLPLRRDASLLLDMAGVDKESLLFLNDEVFIKLARDKVKKSVTLTDHNKLRSSLQFLDEYVVEILDHHQDEMCHNHVSGESRKIAFDNKSALAGSTCTLVTEILMTNKNLEEVDAGLGLSLLGVILLDTMDMSKEAGKGTERDQKAIDFLMKHTNWSALKLDEELREKIMDSDTNLPSRSSLYEFLRDSKFDPQFWMDMLPRDALRIDYKRFEDKEGGMPFGLSSVLLEVKSLVSKEGFYEHALSFMKEADVNLLGVLTMKIVDDKPQRELLLIGNKERTKIMTEYLMSSEAASFLDISKQEVKDIDDDNVSVYFKQGNPKGSRKQVAPVMLASSC